MEEAPFGLAESEADRAVQQHRGQQCTKDGRERALDKMQDRALPVYDECAQSLINGNELFRVLDTLFQASERLLPRGHLPQARHRGGSIGLARQLTLQRVVLIEQGLGLEGSLLCGGLQLATVFAEGEPCSKL